MKRLTYTIIFLLLGMSLGAQSLWDGKREAIRKGSGTESDPYLIENAQNLAWLAYLINYDYSEWTEGKYFLLKTDIDLNGSEDNQWLPIGAGGGNTVYGKCMKGTFDGGGHKITGLYIDNNSVVADNNSIWYANTNAALFSELHSESVVKNLYVEGYISVDNKTCAGVSGRSGNIFRCVSDVDVETEKEGAGLVAMYSNAIEECANYGDINAGTFAGGITAFSKFDIVNCYNMGAVNGSGYVGGITSGAVKGTIMNCYNAGDIDAYDMAEYKGAVVAKLDGTAKVENVYYLDSSIDQNDEYGEALSASVMQSLDFVTMLNNNTNVWMYDAAFANQGFPILTNAIPLSDDSCQQEEEMLMLFPNPAVDYVNIVGDVASYEIYDMLGKSVTGTRLMNDVREQLDVAQYKPGIYFVKCLMKDGMTVTKKVVVK